MANEVQVELPFTAKDSNAITIQTSLVFKPSSSSSYFTDVSLMSQVIDENAIMLSAYNSGSRTVDGQISAHVMERAVY